MSIPKQSMKNSPTWVAILPADVKGGQVALPSTAHKFSDGWSHRGIHDGMDGIVNWVDNEWNDCTALATSSA